MINLQPVRAGLRPITSDRSKLSSKALSIHERKGSSIQAASQLAATKLGPKKDFSDAKSWLETTIDFRNFFSGMTL